MTARRFFLGAFGDAGHAFPIIALGVALHRRGHDVTVQTWDKWRAHVEAEGLTYSGAQHYFGEPLKPLQLAVRAARETAPIVADLAPDLVVSDILTTAPALAGEMAGVPVATLIPHVDPRPEPGFPVYSMGARLPRTALGRSMWQGLTGRLVAGGLEQGRDELNGARTRVGLPPVARVHNGISERLTFVGTFPHLEYPRSRPRPGTHVVGPFFWEIPGEPAVAPPDGLPRDWPVVLLAPSTAHDPEHRMLRAALRGLAGAPVRVIATINRRPPSAPIAGPRNAVLGEWLSYAKTMPACDVVVTHGGHGTVVRALACGCAPVVCPATGDMMENAARVDWAGLGVRVPRRLVTPRGVRLAVERALASRRIRARVEEVAAWARVNDGATRAAELAEELVAARGAATARA